MTDQELYEALGIQHFDGGGVANWRNQGNAPAYAEAEAPKVTYAPKEEVPLPDWVKEIIAQGHGVDPIYETHFVRNSNGIGGYTERGGRNVEHGAPIGYRYDNGKSQYVTLDTSGNVLDVKDRGDAWTDFREHALKPGLAVVAAAYGMPYLTAPATASTAAGAAGSVFGMAPGTAATMANAAIAGGGANAGYQFVNTGDVKDIKSVLESATLSAGTAGAADWLKGTDAFKAIPKGLQPGAVAGTTALVQGKNPLTAFVGAEVSYASNEIAKIAAEKSGLDWNSLPQWTRDSMVTAVGSTAKGGNVTQDVANVMLNAGLNVAKEYATGKGTIPYNYEAGNSAAVPWLDDNSAGGNGSVQQWYKDQVAGEQADADFDKWMRDEAAKLPADGADYTPEQLDALSRVTIDGKNSVSGYADDTAQQLQDAGLTVSNDAVALNPVTVSGNQWVPTDDTDVGDQFLGTSGASDAGALNPVTVTGKKEDLLPLDPQEVSSTANTVTPGTADTTTDKTTTDKTGTDYSKAPSNTTSPGSTSSTTPNTSTADFAYNPQMYDLDASDPVLEWLKLLGGTPAKHSRTAHAAAGGSVDELLQYLRS